MSNKKRKTVFIKRAFQGRFVAVMLAIIVLSGLASSLLLYLLLDSDLQSQAQSAHAAITDTWQRLWISILVGNVIAVLIAGVTAVFMVIQLSHKVAGPLYRFEALFEQVSKGDLSVRAKLRTDDQLIEMAEKFNQMMDSLERQAGRAAKPD
jgi:methyl-accepting chemotaxis protein